MDTGAVDSLSGMQHVEPSRIVQTPASKRGMCYVTASKDHIRNMGQAPVDGYNMEGDWVELTTQVGNKVNKMLVGARNVCVAGNMLVFNYDQESIVSLAKSKESKPENLLMSHKSHRVSEIPYEDGAYRYPIWTQRKLGSHSAEEIAGVKTMDLVTEQNGVFDEDQCGCCIDEPASFEGFL